MPSPSISESFALLMPSPSVSSPLSFVPSPSGSTSSLLLIPSPSISGSVASPSPSLSVSVSINKLRLIAPNPAAFIALIVNWVCVRATVGVPLITPVEVLKLKPEGNVGEIA